MHQSARSQVLVQSCLNSVTGANRVEIIGKIYALYIIFTLIFSFFQPPSTDFSPSDGLLSYWLGVRNPPCSQSYIKPLDRIIERFLDYFRNIRKGNINNRLIMIEGSIFIQSFRYPQLAQGVILLISRETILTLLIPSGRSWRKPAPPLPTDQVKQSPRSGAGSRDPLSTNLAAV